MMAPSAAQKTPAVIPHAAEPKYMNQTVPYLLFVYNAAEYKAYPLVPKIRAAFNPKRFAIKLPVRHENTMRAKRIALPALTHEQVS
jgi:hypothetical protein